MSQLTHFQEITLIADPEITPYFVWGKLFNQLHLAFVDVKNQHGIERIGIAFPDYHFDKKGKSSKLGLKLRVFAPSAADLTTLNLTHWLSRLSDYVHIKGINEVGDKATGQVSVHRYRFKPLEVQAKSLAKKLNISHSEAMATVAKREPEKALPYIQLRSLSNQGNFTLKIWQQPCSKATKGSFNTYGMNGMTQHVSVPHW